MQTPPEDHAQFDAICAQLSDWETLPTMSPKPAEPDEGGELDEEEQTAPLDGLILAGLVAP